MTLALILSAALIMFLLCALAAWAEGRLGRSSLRSDLRQVFHGSRHHPARPIPFLRDYAVMGIIVLAAASYGHFTRQWSRIEKLPSLLGKDGLLRTDIIPEEELRLCFIRLSERSCRLIWELVSLLVSAAILAGVIAAILRHGLYPLLDSGPSVAHVHLVEWWARPTNGWAGFILLIGVLGFFLQITVRHTIMGMHILLWFGDVRRCARKAGGQDWFGYHDPWISPNEALLELRGAILDVFVAITLGAAAAACAVYALAIPAPLLVVLSAYLFYNIAVVIVPWTYLNRQLTTSKQALEAHLLKELGTMSRASSDPHGERVEWLWLAYQRVQPLPERVVDRLPVGALLALYLIPIAALIPAYR